MSLDAVNVSWGVGRKVIVDRVNAHVEPGSTMGILGPNGSGKSSLLRLLAGLRRPSSGAVLVDGTDLSQISRRALARRLAVVEQDVTTEVDLTVAEIVGLGRTPYRRGWAAARGPQDPTVTAAMEHTDISELAHRRWQSLSGGERQRTQIARALAQEPSELLLDEPTNHLDVAHQLDLLALVRDLPVTTVVVLHDLNLAAAYCDRIMVMAHGRVVATGSPAEVLTAALIAEVYDVQAEVSSIDGRPHVRYLETRGRSAHPGRAGSSCACPARSAQAPPRCTCASR